MSLSFLGPSQLLKQNHLQNQKSAGKDVAEMNKYAHKKRQPTREPAG
jgi:hypothetical protein